MVALESILFYKYAVLSQVFYKSAYTYALVNLKPLVKGHVLVVPLRTQVKYFNELTPEEGADYTQSLQLINRFLRHVYHADALNMSIQDGPELGQSIPHLHTHLIPRFKLDNLGDELYQQIEELDLDADYRDFYVRKASFQASGGNFESIDEESRVPRTPEVMRKEADWLRKELDEFVRKQ